jgi:hypothetical protein
MCCGREMMRRGPPGRGGEHSTQRGRTAAALFLLLTIATPIVLTFLAINAASQAVSSILTPEDPVTAAAGHLDQLNAYMQAGVRNDPAAAYAFYVHEAGWDASSQTDIATEFKTHREHYQGFKALTPVDFGYVNVFGGSNYYELSAKATYAEGKPRTVQADMAQYNGRWQLIAVKFAAGP